MREGCAGPQGSGESQEHRWPLGWRHVLFFYRGEFFFFFTDYLSIFSVFVYVECFVVLNCLQPIYIHAKEWHFSPVLVLCKMMEMCQPDCSSGYPIGSTYVYDHKHIRNPQVALRDSSLKTVVCLVFFLLGKNILGFWMIGSVGRNRKSYLEKKKSGFSGGSATGWKEVNKCFLKKPLFFNFLIGFHFQTFYHCLLTLYALHRHNLFCLQASLLPISLASGWCFSHGLRCLHWHSAKRSISAS